MFEGRTRAKRVGQNAFLEIKQEKGKERNGNAYQPSPSLQFNLRCQTKRSFLSHSLFSREPILLFSSDAFSSIDNNEKKKTNFLMMMREMIEQKCLYRGVWD